MCIFEIPTPIQANQGGLKILDENHVPEFSIESKKVKRNKS